MNRQPDSKKKSTEETSELKERIRELEKSEAERGHVQQALRESEERWQFALEGAGDGVWDWNAQTNEVFFSKQWKAMLGFTEDEIGGTFDEWDRRVHPDDREYAHAEINRHFEGKSPVYINEHRIKCKGRHLQVDSGPRQDHQPDARGQAPEGDRDPYRHDGAQARGRGAERE